MRDDGASTVRYVSSERGNEKLVDSGFIYVEEKVGGDVVHWRCEFFNKKKCRARGILAAVKK